MKKPTRTSSPAVGGRIENDPASIAGDGVAAVPLHFPIRGGSGPQRPSLGGLAVRLPGVDLPLDARSRVVFPTTRQKVFQPRTFLSGSGDVGTRPFLALRASCTTRVNWEVLYLHQQVLSTFVPSFLDAFGDRTPLAPFQGRSILPSSPSEEGKIRCRSSPVLLQYRNGSERS